MNWALTPSQSLPIDIDLPAVQERVYVFPGISRTAFWCLVDHRLSSTATCWVAGHTGSHSMGIWHWLFTLNVQCNLHCSHGGMLHVTWVQMTTRDAKRVICVVFHARAFSELEWLSILKPFEVKCCSFLQKESNPLNILKWERGMHVLDLQA